MADKIRAVRLNNRRKIRSTEPAVGHPARKLLMPYAGVAAEELSVRLGKVCNHVSAGESEHAAGLLCGVPLHAVAGCDRPELGGVVEQLEISSVGELAVVSRAAEVLLSSCFGGRVQLCCGCTSRESGDRSGSRATGRFGGGGCSRALRKE